MRRKFKKIQIPFFEWKRATGIRLRSIDPDEKVLTYNYVRGELMTVRAHIVRWRVAKTKKTDNPELFPPILIMRIKVDEETIDGIQ